MGNKGKTTLGNYGARLTLGDLRSRSKGKKGGSPVGPKDRKILIKKTLISKED